MTVKVTANSSSLSCCWTYECEGRGSQRTQADGKRLLTAFSSAKRSFIILMISPLQHCTRGRQVTGSQVELFLSKTLFVRHWVDHDASVVEKASW